MKKIIIIMLICIMLFSGCEASNSQIKNFGTEYSEENKYMAMLPDGISVPMEYNDIIDLKGKSQYRVYEEIFLNRQCVLSFRFEKGNLKELAYIYECENEKEMDKTAKYIYRCFEDCYGKPDWLTDYESMEYHASWNSSIENCTIEIYTRSKNNIVLCTMSFSDSFAGIEEETTAYSYTTTTTAYEWKLNTDSTGYDWISVNNTEKEVWCSNSIAAWRLMGYDIPDGISTKSMVKAIDKLYEDETYLKYDLATISEMFAIANDIY